MIPTSFVDIMRRRAAEDPDVTAFVFVADDGEEMLTYAQLWREVCSVSARLATARGCRALLLLGGARTFVPTFLGCLHAGVVAVPFQYSRRSSARAKLEAVCGETQAGHVLTDERTLRFDASAGVLDATRLPVIVVDAPHAESAIDANDAYAPEGNAVAVLQCTSGSTALPKAVMLTHRNLLANHELIRHSLRLGRDAVVVSWLPLYHDMGLANVLHAVYLGCRCVLLEPAHFLRQPRTWLETMARHRGTISGGPNFAFDHCADKIAPLSLEGVDLSSWAIAFTGSERVQASTLERFADAFAGHGFQRKAFYPGYGLAESTFTISGGFLDGGSSIIHVDPRSTEPGATVMFANRAGGTSALVSSGRPHQLVRIVGADGRALGDDVVGEIWTAGPSVGAGYWNRAAESEAIFSNRLDNDPGQCFLRTGDLGFLHGGDLFVVGRIKDLIIVRGRKFSADAVEQCVRTAVPALASHRVAAFSADGGASEQLIVVAEPASMAKPDADVVALAICRILTEALDIRPQYVVIVKPGRVPVTSSGKVERGETKRRYLAGTLDALGVWSDRSSVEAGLAEVPAPADPLAWLVQRVAARTATDPPMIDLDASLEYLGLDSLMIMELVRNVEEAFERSISPAYLFDGASLREVAERISVAPQVQRKGPTLVKHVRSQATARELVQWVNATTRPEPALDHLAYPLTVDGPLDVAALQAAMCDLTRKHQALRTGYQLAPDGRLERVVTMFAEHVVREENAADCDVADLILAATDERFDLAVGPLLRVVVYALTPQRWLLVFVAHHIVMDLGSLEVMFGDLSRRYERYCGVANTAALGGPLPLLASAPDETEAEVSAALAYWRTALPDPMPAIMAFHAPRDPLRRGAPVCSAPLTFSPDDTAAVVAGAKSLGVTVYVMLLAVTFVVLCRLSGESRLIVSSPLAGRQQSGDADTVGNYTSAALLYADLSDDPTFAALLGRLRHRVAEALAHQRVHITRVMRELAARVPPNGRFPQVVVLWQNQPQSSLALSGSRTEYVEPPLRAIEADLLLDLRLTNSLLGGTVYGRSDLFNNVALRSMAETLARATRELVAAPAARVLGASERHDVPSLAQVQADLRSLCETVLDVSAVDLTQSFLELGGDSIGAAMLIARIAETYEVNVPSELLFGSNPLVEVAHYVHEAMGAAGGAALNLITPPAAATAELDAMMASVEKMSPEQRSELLRALEVLQ